MGRGVAVRAWVWSHIAILRGIRHPLGVLWVDHVWGNGCDPVMAYVRWVVGWHPVSDVILQEQVLLQGLDQKEPVSYGYGHWEALPRAREDMQSVSCDVVVWEVSPEVYLPQLACCASEPPPHVVCQMHWRVGSCAVIRVCEESVVVDLYVEIRICWVIRGWGGVSLVAACRGTVGILAVVGRWRSPGTACA